MENQNTDTYHNNVEYTDAFLNTIENDVYPNYQSTQNDPIGIGSSEAFDDFWDFPEDPNLQYPPLLPFENNAETSNQIGTNLGNEIQEPALLPLPSNATGDFDNNLFDLPPIPENSNLGNGIQEPFSFPPVILPFTEQTGDAVVECNGETSNHQRNANSISEQSLQVQFNCQCCEILREIVHIGSRLLRLRIHGRLAGVIFHAVLDIEPSSQGVSRETFDFFNMSYEDVKQYLKQYCKSRKEEGYKLMMDKKSGFFEALCVGFDWCENLANEAHPGNVRVGGDNNRGKAPLVEEAANNNNKDKNLISMAVQRKRVKEMKTKDLTSYLHLPRREAALKLGLSETVVHKIWRKGSGTAKRWPHRKIQSKKKEIMKLEAELADPNTPQHARDSAAKLLRFRQEELNKLYNQDA